MNGPGDKPDTNFRSPEHRAKIEAVRNKVLFPTLNGIYGEVVTVTGMTQAEKMTEIEKEISTAFSIIFSINKYEVTQEDISFFKQLINYIIKRHIHKTSTQLTHKDEYDEYMRDGVVNTPVRIPTNSGEVKIRHVDTDFSFSLEHELPHYLIAYLYNHYTKENSNSITPTYINNKIDRGSTKRVSLSDKDRTLTEESYAGILTFEAMEYVLSGNAIYNKKTGGDFREFLLSTVMSALDTEVGFLNTSSNNSDILAATNMRLKIFTDLIDSEGEKLEELKSTYPVECFIYEVAHAIYYELGFICWVYSTSYLLSFGVKLIELVTKELVSDVGVYLRSRDTGVT